MADRWYPGKARASQEVNVAFEAPGRVIDFPLKVGDRVTEGQVLAQLDPSDFQNDLAAARAQLEQAKAFLGRIEQAAKTGAVAQQQVTDAKAQFDVANANVEIRKKALADTTIQAPFAATVATKFVDNFQNVQAKQPVVRLLDTSSIEMTIDVPEDVISLVPFVQDIRCRFEAFPGREVSATIEEVGNEPSETTRTFPVTLVMDQPDDIKILPGMSGEVTGRVVLPEGGLAQGFEVPAAAVFEESGGVTSVWIIDEANMTVRKQPVKIEALSERGVRISGVAAKSLVATAGVHFLSEGQTVTVLGDTAGGSQ